MSLPILRRSLRGALFRRHVLPPRLPSQRRLHTTSKANNDHPTRPPAKISFLARYYPDLRLSSKLLSAATGTLLAAHLFFEYFFECNATVGISMLPTIESFGDWVVISKRERRGRDVKVGDLVSYEHPIRRGVHGIKRVVGLQGDFVVRDTPGVAGEGVMIQVPEGHCWIVGDNLTWSRDSRMFGPLPLALVRGKVVAKYSPNLSMSPLKLVWFENKQLKPVMEDEGVD